jgi:hypothetical protein
VTKLGGMAGPRIAWTRPKPPAVEDRYLYWGQAPPDLSDRCQWWVEQFDAGFRPNRAYRMEGYDTSAELYGVWIWEYLNVICPREMAPR